MRFQAERAHRLYDEAFALLPEADRRAQKPGLMMANIYRTLLREIEADGFRVLHQRTSLTPLRKLWIAWRTQLARPLKPLRGGRGRRRLGRHRRRGACAPGRPRGRGVRDGAAARRARAHGAGARAMRWTTASTS